MISHLLNKYFSDLLLNSLQLLALFTAAYVLQLFPILPPQHIREHRRISKCELPLLTACQLVRNSVVLSIMSYALCPICHVSPMPFSSDYVGWFSSMGFSKVTVANPYTCYLKQIKMSLLVETKRHYLNATYAYSKRLILVGSSCSLIDYLRSLSTLSYVIGVWILWMYTLASRNKLEKKIMAGDL